MEEGAEPSVTKASMYLGLDKTLNRDQDLGCFFGFDLGQMLLKAGDCSCMYVIFIHREDYFKDHSLSRFFVLVDGHAIILNILLHLRGNVRVSNHSLRSPCLWGYVFLFEIT